VTLFVMAWPPNLGGGGAENKPETLWVEHQTYESGQDDAPALAACVTKALRGMPLPPKDSNLASGGWRIVFKPT